MQKSFICNARNHSHARQEIIHMQCKKSFTYNARNHSHALQEIIHMQCKKTFICNARNQYDILQGIIIRNYNLSLHCIINYVMHCNKPLNSKAKNIIPLHRCFLCILFSETIFFTKHKQIYKLITWQLYRSRKMPFYVSFPYYAYLNTIIIQHL